MENSIHDLPHRWGSDGEDYRFEYDLAKGETRVVDSLGREERYYWGAMYGVYHHIYPLGQCWHSVDAHDNHKTPAWNRYGQLLLYRDCPNS
ncbi:MAG: hypothetical protein MUW57_15205 [Pseudomonas sp.]|nr:hypothetical protein [Pseudomonas sp.]